MSKDNSDYKKSLLQETKKGNNDSRLGSLGQKNSGSNASPDRQNNTKKSKR